MIYEHVLKAFTSGVKSLQGNHRFQWGKSSHSLQSIEANLENMILLYDKNSQLETKISLSKSSPSQKRQPST